MPLPRIRFASAPQRLDALSDGVFAIVLTLLALELRIPDREAGESFLTVLLANTAVLESYVISFFVVGVLWRLQHMASELTPRGTAFHHSLTLAFLATVTLTPWSLSNITSFPDDPVAVMGFSGTLLVSWALLIAVLTFAQRIASADTLDEIRAARRSLFGGPLVACISLAIAPLSTAGALYVWLLLIPYGFYARRSVTDAIDQK